MNDEKRRVGSTKPVSGDTNVSLQTSKQNGEQRVQDAFLDARIPLSRCRTSETRLATFPLVVRLFRPRQGTGTENDYSSASLFMAASTRFCEWNSVRRLVSSARGGCKNAGRTAPRTSPAAMRGALRREVLTSEAVDALRNTPFILMAWLFAMWGLPTLKW